MADLIDGWKFEVRDGVWWAFDTEQPDVSVTISDDGEGAFLADGMYSTSAYTLPFSVIDELRKRQKHGEEDG